MIDVAKELEEGTRTKFTISHDPELRGDAKHKTEILQKLNEYFKKEYSEKIQNNELPYKLLDAKETLKKIRTTVSQEFKVSFSDKELLSHFKVSDIPEEIKMIIDKILEMYPGSKDLSEKMTASEQKRLF